MCCEKTFDGNEVGDEGPQRSNAASEQESEDLSKPDARLLCPICLHPYKLVGFMYKHMQKAHPESFKLIAEMLGADEETLHGQGHDDELPVCSEKTPVNFGEGSNDEQGSVTLPSTSDKKNVVPDENQASSSCEQQVDSIPSSLRGPYSRRFAAKKVIPESTRSCGSSKTAGADGCQTAPRPKRAKTDTALRVRFASQKNLEGEVLQETFPPKKLVEQFRFLYFKGLYNMWLECANQQNRGSSNADGNEHCVLQGSKFLETLNLEAVYIDPFLTDSGITTVDLGSGEEEV